jgi:hypothetical protein
MFGSLNPCQYKFMSASGLLKKATGLGSITGILAATSSSAIIIVWDGQDATGTLGPTQQVTGQITLVAGTPYPIPAKLNNGLYIQLVSGTGGWTVFYD